MLPALSPVPTPVLLSLHPHPAPGQVSLPEHPCPTPISCPQGSIDPGSFLECSPSKSCLAPNERGCVGPPTPFPIAAGSSFAIKGLEIGYSAHQGLRVFSSPSLPSFFQD